MTSHAYPMGDIEHWRNEALILARSNNLGNLLKTSLELMNSVIMSGPHSKTLPLKVQALLMECTSAHEDHPNSTDDSTMLHYGVTSTICALLTSLSGSNETGSGIGANQHQVEDIEQWRNKALHFSRTDSLGQIIKDALELMQSVVATGLRAQTLPLKLKAMSMECASAMADDPNRDDRSRSLHYGVIFAICTLLEAMTTKENAKATEKIETPIRGIRKVRFAIEEDRISPSSAEDDSISMDGTNKGTVIQGRHSLEITSSEAMESTESAAEIDNNENDNSLESEEERPPLTYREMIVDALENSDAKQLSAAEICEHICEKYPYYRAKPETVEKSVSACLSKHFRSVISGLTTWRMYYKKRGSDIQEMRPAISATDNEEANDSIHEYEEERPQMAYREMIIAALETSETKELSAAEICKYICDKYSYYRDKVEALEKSISRCLSKHFRQIASGLTMWRMYYKQKTNAVQEQCSLETTDDEEPHRKKGRMVHSINQIHPVPSMNNNTRPTEHDWMNAVDMTNFGENISPIMDHQIRNVKISANASPFEDDSSTSMGSPINEVSQSQPAPCSTTTTFVDCEPSGMDQNESRLEDQEANTSESEIILNKPSKTYREIIIDILKSSPTGHLSAVEIIQRIRDQYPFYRENYTEKAINNIITSILSRKFQKIMTNNKHALWTIPSENTASSIVNEPPASIASQIDEVHREQTVEGLSTSTFVDCEHSGMDNDDSRLQDRERKFVNENVAEKPSKSYREIIFDILKNCSTKFLTAAQIVKCIRDQYPYYRENYTEQAVKCGITSTLSTHFKKINTDTIHPLWSIRSEDNTSNSIFIAESTPEPSKTYKQQIEEALKSSEIGHMTSMEISQFICEKYPTKCNAYVQRQRFSSCLFKHFKKTVTNGGITLWSIRSEEEGNHMKFPIESAVSNANISESVQPLVSDAAESSKNSHEEQQSSEKYRKQIEDVLKKSETGMLDYAEISDIIYDQYPNSSIAELNREINTCLLEYFEQTVSRDGHSLWSIRTEIQANASVESEISDFSEIDLPEIFEADTVCTVSDVPEETRDSIDSQQPRKSYREKAEEALRSSKTGKMTSMEITEYIKERYPTDHTPQTLRGSITSTFSKYFKKTKVPGECPLWSMRSENETDSCDAVGNDVNPTPRTSGKRRLSSVIDSSSTPIPTKRERRVSTNDLEMPTVSSIRGYSPEL